MKTESELPSDVIDAINAGRKIDAIKLLREHRNLGLTEAKHIVDVYVQENAQLKTTRHSRAESSVTRVVLLVIVIAAAYGAYRYFA